MSRTVISLALAAFVAGCGASQPESGPAPPSGNANVSQSALLNTYWRITMLDTLRIPADTGRRDAHMQITESGGALRYSSTVGCNGVGGDATVSGDQITFGPGMSTKMWCGDELNDRETRLAAALTGTRRWVITGDTLELRDEGAVRRARLVKGVPPR